MTTQDIVLIAKALAKKYGKRKTVISEAITDFQENSTKVFLFKSTQRVMLDGVGYAFPVSFSSNKDSKKKFYRLATNNTVYCYVLNASGKDVDTLDFNWNKGKKTEFTIRNANDYQRLKTWYNQQRKWGKVVSQFFIK